ncbi:MAG: hypothetical protein ABJ242_08285 [Marinomonas sp.]
MAISTKYFALPTLIGAGLTLAACGGAGNNEAIYEEFAKSCASSFATEGGSGEMAKAICDCTADEMRAQEMGPLDMIDQEKTTAIGEKCAAEFMSGDAMDASGEEAAPAE